MNTVNLHIPFNFYLMSSIELDTKISFRLFYLLAHYSNLKCTISDLPLDFQAFDCTKSWVRFEVLVSLVSHNLYSICQFVSSQSLIYCFIHLYLNFAQNLQLHLPSIDFLSFVKTIKSMLFSFNLCALCAHPCKALPNRSISMQYIVYRKPITDLNGFSSCDWSGITRSAQNKLTSNLEQKS